MTFRSLKPCPGNHAVIQGASGIINDRLPVKKDRKVFS